MAENNDTSAVIAKFIGGVVGWVVGSAVSTYVGLTVLKWLGVAF